MGFQSMGRQRAGKRWSTYLRTTTSSLNACGESERPDHTVNTSESPWSRASPNSEAIAAPPATSRRTGPCPIANERFWAFHDEASDALRLAVYLAVDAGEYNRAAALLDLAEANEANESPSHAQEEGRRRDA